MANINSTLYLLKNVPLDPNYNFTMDFENKQAQDSFFDSLIDNTLQVNEDYSYIRDTEQIKVFANVDNLLGVNYLYYNNGGKRYYAFITKKDYVSQTCTAITFKIDVMQSFLFDYEIDESFIDREHQDRYYIDQDKLVPQFNRQAENIDRGVDFECVEVYRIQDNLPAELEDIYNQERFRLFWATIICKEPIGSDGYKAVTSVKGMPTNIYSYVAPIAIRYGINAGVVEFKLGKDGSNADISNLNQYYALNLSSLYALSQEPKVISINISRYAPFNYKTRKDVGSYTLYTIYPAVEGDDLFNTYQLSQELYTYTYNDKSVYAGLYRIKDSYSISQPIFNVPKALTKPINSLNISNLKSYDYEPKLLTRDYGFYSLEYASLKQEYDKTDFNPNEINFKLMPTYSVRNTATIVPTEYKKELDNFNYAVKLDSGYNELPLRTDAWLQYLSQNKNSLVTGLTSQAITGTLAVAGSLVAGGPLGIFGAIQTGVSTANSIASTIANIKDLKNTPDQVAKPTLDIVEDYVNKNGYMELKTYRIRENYWQLAFNYFYRYGYKCNRFKKPNTRSRYYFNYIKTIGANIKTNIDADYRQQIVSIYDNGITIWHYRDTNTFKGVNNFDYENAEINLIGGIS